MKSSTYQLLKNSDDIGYEVPSNDWKSFPYQELAKSVKSIQDTIFSEVGLKLARDGNVQDASFHDDLVIYRPIDGTPNHFYYAFCIRFSNFGRLFTIYGLEEKIFVEYPLETVRRIVERHGWQYVPPDELSQPYDGINDSLRASGTTWWIRFFDYL